MRRRRFFRVLTLTLLLLCLGAWGWSYFYSDSLGYKNDARLYGVALERRGVLLVTTDSIVSAGGWRRERSKPDPDMFESLGGRRFMGFGYLNAPVFLGTATALRIPFWFPTLLLAALTAWAWRKRRSEGERGFAVGEAGVKEAG